MNEFTVNSKFCLSADCKVWNKLLLGLLITQLFLFGLVLDAKADNESDIQIYSIMCPVPINRAMAKYASGFAKELDRIKDSIPAINLVYILFGKTSTQNDWLALLDICYQKGMRVNVRLNDPKYINEKWVWGNLGDFVSNRECITHPALYAVFMIDEPWEH